MSSIERFFPVTVSVVAMCVLHFGPGSSVAAGQTPDLDSLRHAQQSDVDRYRAQEAAAAAVFLDSGRSVNDRLAAARDITSFIDRQRIAGAIRTVFDRAEPMAIRVRALQLVGAHLARDTTFAQRVFGIVTDTGSAELRAEAVSQITLVMFSPPAPREGFFRTLRFAGRDPDIEIRRAALGTLAGHGDSATLVVLQEGLATPAKALLPPSEAVRLLGLRDPAPYYATLHQVMVEPPDTATRLAAIQLLGGYASSRQAIAEYLRDRNETPAIRQAALGALAAGDPRGFPQHVLQIVADESAPLDLRVRAIKTVEVMRTSRDPQVVGRAPDAFDRLAQRLAQSSPTPAVRDAARAFLTRTKSPR